VDGFLLSRMCISVFVLFILAIIFREKDDTFTVQHPTKFIALGQSVFLKTTEIYSYFVYRGNCSSFILSYDYQINMSSRISYYFKANGMIIRYIPQFISLCHHWSITESIHFKFDFNFHHTGDFSSLFMMMCNQNVSSPQFSRPHS